MRAQVVRLKVLSSNSVKLPAAPILVMIAQIEAAVEFKVWQAIQGGLDMVILRAKEDDLESIKTTLSNMRTSLGNQFPIMVNAGPRLPKFAQATGYHLPEVALRDEIVRHGLEKLGWKIGAKAPEPPTPTPPIASLTDLSGVSVPPTSPSASSSRKGQGLKGLGISVHSVESAQEAEKLFPDYLLVGTVFASASHKGQKAGGVEHLHAICKATTVPVIAIGGVTPQNAGECIRAGAVGVAALSPFKGAGREALSKAYKDAMKA
jgi:thiamine monophosphate synthase